jgi:hypothetical protein
LWSAIAINHAAISINHIDGCRNDLHDGSRTDSPPDGETELFLAGFEFNQKLDESNMGLQAVIGSRFRGAIDPTADPFCSGPSHADGVPFTGDLSWRWYRIGSAWGARATFVLLNHCFHSCSSGSQPGGGRRIVNCQSQPVAKTLLPFPISPTEKRLKFFNVCFEIETGDR